MDKDSGLYKCKECRYLGKYFEDERYSCGGYYICERVKESCIPSDIINKGYYCKFFSKVE